MEFNILLTWIPPYKVAATDHGTNFSDSHKQSHNVFIFIERIIRYLFEVLLVHICWAIALYFALSNKWSWTTVGYLNNVPTTHFQSFFVTILFLYSMPILAVSGHLVLFRLPLLLFVFILF